MLIQSYKYLIYPFKKRGDMKLEIPISQFKDIEEKKNHLNCVTCRNIINFREECLTLEKVSNWVPPLPNMYFCSWKCLYQFVEKLKGKDISEGWKIQGYKSRRLYLIE